VVERVTRAGLVDDGEFARDWVENRVQFKPRGARALHYELREKGIADSIIADALVDLDEEVAARQVAQAGARRMAHLEPRDFRRKLSAYMARRGFSYAAIAPLVDELLDAKSCEALVDIESEVKDNG